MRKRRTITKIGIPIKRTKVGCSFQQTANLGTTNSSTIDVCILLCVAH
jgi:hypothetical protein